MVVTRRTAREWAVQMLVSAEMNPPADLPTMFNTFWHELAETRPSGRIRKVTEDRVVGVLSSLTKIDAALSEHLENWELDRLGTVERAVLRMGVWEIDNTDVPATTVINECVDIVNWFSMPQSRSLVNGVLDGYRKAVGK